MPNNGKDKDYQALFSQLHAKTKILLTKYVGKTDELTKTRWLYSLMGHSPTRISDIDFIQRVDRGLASGKREANAHLKLKGDVDALDRELTGIYKSNYRVLLGAYLLVYTQVKSSQAGLCQTIEEILDIKSKTKISLKAHYLVFSELFAYVNEEPEVLEFKDGEVVRGLIESTLNEYQEKCSQGVKV